MAGALRAVSALRSALTSAQFCEACFPPHFRPSLALRHELHRSEQLAVCTTAASSLPNSSSMHSPKRHSTPTMLSAQAVQHQPTSSAAHFSSSINARNGSGPRCWQTRSRPPAVEQLPHLPQPAQPRPTSGRLHGPQDGTAACESWHDALMVPSAASGWHLPASMLPCSMAACPMCCRAQAVVTATSSHPWSRSHATAQQRSHTSCLGAAAARARRHAVWCACQRSRSPVRGYARGNNQSRGGMQAADREGG